MPTRTAVARGWWRLGAGQAAWGEALPNVGAGPAEFGLEQLLWQQTWEGCPPRPCDPVGAARSWASGPRRWGGTALLTPAFSAQPSP